MSDHQDLKDYKLWLRAALVDEGLTSPSNRFDREAAADWELMLPDHQKQYADTVRSVWDARRDLIGAGIHLRDAASNVLVADLSSAEKAWEAFLKMLEARLLAIDGVMTHLTHLQKIQNRNKSGRFSEHLQRYVQECLDTAESDAANSFNQRDVLKMFDELDWSDDSLDSLKALAEVITGELTESRPTFPPAKSRSFSNQKRKRDGDHIDEASRSGANPSKRHSGKRDVSAEAGAAALRSQEEYLDGQPLPHPGIGVAGTFASWIFRNEQRFGHSYKSWLHRQLQRADCQTMEELEHVAELLVRMHKQVHHDHDWEKEEDIPIQPFEEDYLDRHGPNVGRLKRMIYVPGATDCQRYVVRHLYAFDEKMHENADAIAYELIPLVRKKGLAHHWEDEPDIYRITPPNATEAARIPLHSVSMPYVEGEWKVSTLVILALPHLSDKLIVPDNCW